MDKHDKVILPEAREFFCVPEKMSDEEVYEHCKGTLFWATRKANIALEEFGRSVNRVLAEAQEDMRKKVLGIK